METKHTPGPWKVFDEHGNYIHCTIMDETNTRLCEVRKFNVGQKYVLANAKLIAAAPELLELLYAMVVNFGFSSATTPEQGKLIQKAHETIKKATT